MGAFSLRSIAAGAVIALLVPALALLAGRPAQAQDNCQTFDVTGFEVCDDLLEFWNENGGLPVFGYPITAATQEVSPDTGETHTVQYFERERLESHPENPEPYHVLLGRLGDEVLALSGRDWQTFEKMDPGSENYFAETGFAIAPEFLDYWSSHGLEYGDPGFSFRESLLLFGFPISAPQMETNPDGDTVLTQWFERARFEHHPDNPTDSQVLLGRLGAEYLDLTEDPGDGETVAAELVAENLTSPLTVTEAPDGSGRLYVVDQIGQIRIVTPDGALVEQPFLDVSDRMIELNPGYDERGLLGLAFHPDYAENGRFFIYYSAPLGEGAPDDWDHTNILAEFRVSESDPLVADPGSEQILLALDWPAGNHNGGTVAFGPHDGYLYLSLGDGGGGGDVGNGHVEDWYDFNPGGNGQDIEQNLLGSILRLDVSAADGSYAIPPDNPFIEGPGLDEIYAYGFRNPYRIAFDTGGEQRMFAGDAGQALWEEVSVVEPGGNYGWNVYEGTHCFDATSPGSVPEDCPDMVGESHPDAGAPLLMPVIEFPNSNQPDGLGQTVVGGNVYRAGEIGALDGRYIFGAWSAGEDVGGNRLPGRIFVSSEQPSGLWAFEELALSNMPDGAFGHFVLGFGQDNAGNVFITATDNQGPEGSTGKVYRLAPGE
jgi:glucose/arabinose dehydrogenase